jgi:hypothetical protein
MTLQEKMEFQFEFVDRESNPFNFRIKIKANHQEDERIISYEQLREIHQVLKPYNIKACHIFPRFKLTIIFQPQNLDLERFRKV